MVAYKVADSGACACELNKVWKAVWPFLESDNAVTRKAAADSLGLLSQCFSSEMVQAAIEEKAAGKPDAKSVLGTIINQTTKATNSLAFARSMTELLSVISSLIMNLRHEVGGRMSSTAIQTLLLPLIKHIGDLRIQKGFEHKEAADTTLGTAMRVLGPAVLLEALPLNLEPADR